MNQATQRARQSGGNFRPLPGIAVDIAVLAAEPFPDEIVKETQVIQAPIVPVAPQIVASSHKPARKKMLVLPPPPSQALAPPPPPKPAPVASQSDDDEIKEIFFSTYHEKVWAGPQS